MSQVSFDESLHSLPSTMTPLVGREREIEAVCDLLRRPSVRLVTLVGPGGVGKTRLALAAAERTRASVPDGVVFVPLQATADASLLLPVISRATGVREFGERPPLRAIADAVRGRELLLVLDNFEQLLAAGPQVIELLSTCPDLKVLVTSRAVLHLSGEHDFIVPPLSVPETNKHTTPAELAGSDAVRLFIERATAARSDFTLSDESLVAIAAICARVDGLPLAIELAAARMRSLSPAALLARLERRLRLLTAGPRDVPSRHQTMRATIAWSYDLISAEQQRLFRSHAAFRGGASLEAIESVCAAEAARASEGAGFAVLEDLDALVDHSLVQHREQPDGSSRFEMLETIREFGLEQLDARGETADVRARHARCFLELALQAELELFGPRQKVWFERLEHDHANLRAALDWALEHDLEAALQAAAALGYFWVFRAHFSEARSWLDIALARDGNVTPRTRARAFDAAAGLASWQGDHRRASELFQAALRIFREIDDRPNIANTLRGMCRLALVMSDFEQADIYGMESVALFEALGDTRGLMAAVGNRGWNALARGDLERATSLITQALTLARQRGDAAMVANHSAGLGFVALGREDTEGATRLFGDGLRLGWELDDRRIVALCLQGLGGVATVQGKMRRAARLFGAFGEMREVLGMAVIEHLSNCPGLKVLKASEVVARAQLDSAAFDAAVSEGRRMTLEQAITYALTDKLPGATPEPGDPCDPCPNGLLTPRELDVLRLVAQGMTDREIGGALFISHHTVMRHVSRILGKLDVDSRTAAAAYALRHDLI
jgi:predicted ATPase/DNA-binding CsgD family transcriptional regulator